MKRGRGGKPRTGCAMNDGTGRRERAREARTGGERGREEGREKGRMTGQLLRLGEDGTERKGEIRNGW